MGNFLNNIITRHSAQSLGRVSAHIVEPRLKSRYEADPDNGNPARPDRKIDQASRSLTGSFPQSQSVAPVFIPDNHAEKPAHGFSVERSDSLTSSVSRAPVKGRLATPIPTDSTHYQRKPGIEAQTETTRHSESENSQQPGVDHLLNQRIATLLRDLNNKPGSYLDQAMPEAAGKTTAPTQTVIRTPPVVQGSTVEPETRSGSTDSLKTQSSEKYPVSPERLQTGLFQTPEWLAEIRSDLQKRVREPSAQQPSEPVINVTIGRVEIRATSAPAAQPSAAGNQPRGIMSLDDYLEKRNGRPV